MIRPPFSPFLKGKGMIVIFGTRLFGKVDKIPGVFHVATQFAHINYVPLVPTKSWLVTSEQGKGWRGVPIPLSPKSIFIAWACCRLVVAAVIGGIMCIVG